MPYFYPHPNNFRQPDETDRKAVATMVDQKRTIVNRHYASHSAPTPELLDEIATLDKAILRRLEQEKYRL